MALHAAEEESIEALKKWWEDNNRTLIAALVIAAVAWGGWTFWENSRTGSADAASDLYEQIMDLAAVEPGTPINEANRTRIAELAASLKSEHADSTYALYAALFAAQQAVANNALSDAEQELRWVLEHGQGGMFKPDNTTLLLVANLRLGRVILAQGDSDRALELVNQVDPGALEAEFAELRGDIYLAMGRIVDARDSYLAAQQAGNSSQFLRMKLDELATEG